MKIYLLTISAIASFAMLYATPAQAQATRTWVSGVGDDTNPCSRTAPCKTFAGAISKTATGGEINVLDPGGFGAVTITKSITIRSDHIEAGVLVSGTNGIIVSIGAADKVLLDGLDIQGLGTGLDGVRMTSGGKLFIRNTLIQGFTQNGVETVAPAANPAPRIVIQNSVITGNAGGFNVAGGGGAANNGEVLNSLIDANTNFNLQVGAGGVVILSASTLTGTPTNIVTSSGGQVISYGNNTLRNTGLPTSTTPLQ